MIRVLAGLAAAGTLASCAPIGPPPVPGQFDGSYVGTVRVVGFSSPGWRCDWRAPPITVIDSRFTADIDGADMTVWVRPNGAFDSYASRPVYRGTRYMSLIHIKGRFTGPGPEATMTATVLQPRCTFKLAYSRTSSAKEGQ